MKRIILIFALAGFALGVYGQAEYTKSTNTFSIGKSTGTPLVDSKLRLNGATSGYQLLKPQPIAGSYSLFLPKVTANDTLISKGTALDGDDYYVQLLPDTTHVTAATYTVLSTDAGKVVVFENDFTLVTIDTYANQSIPVGSFTTFLNAGGVVKFTGTGIHSELDSVSIDFIYGWAQLWKRGQNNNVLFGSLR